ADRDGAEVHYDHLILATGATHSYFGHQEFAQYAPVLKTLADAEAIRNRILRAFEQAEAEEDPAKHRDLLTFVLVAAGPAGVEMASALRVEPDLTVPGHREIFVFGDTATLERDGKPLAGVAQVAMQQGRYAGRLIERHVTGRPALPPFR